jgi:hypothetical protein
MSENRMQDKVEKAAPDSSTRVAQRARHAFDAWVASKLHNESTDVEGVVLKRGEVAYCAIEGAGLVTPRRNDARAVTDTGSFVVTNQRCVFVGSKRSTEWAYSKLVSYSFDGEALAIFNVSNRQKPSGVKYDLEVGPKIDAVIAAAIARFRGADEYAALVDQLEQDYHRAHAEWEEAGAHAPPTV